MPWYGNNNKWLFLSYYDYEKVTIPQRHYHANKRLFLSDYYQATIIL